MEINQQGLDLIKSFEGCKLNAYLDSVNVPTIGYGATYYENGEKVKLGDKITQQRADELFKFHIKQFSVKVRSLIKSNVNDNQFSALVSFAFNCGIANLQKSTLLKKVNANANDITISNEFMKWNKAGGKVLNGLTRRRKAEADLYFSK
jgi:lysozyme